MEKDPALAAADSVVFVLTAEPPVSANERDLLVRVAADLVRTSVVSNKNGSPDDAELRVVPAS